MKTILLLAGAALFLESCIDTSNLNEPQDLPVEEMKSRVEAEEIYFEKELNEPIADVENEKIERLTLEKPIVDPETPPYPSDMIEVKDPDSFGIDQFPQVSAVYPGGIEALKKFINSNLAYPQVDGGFDYQGTVYVSFVIEKDGSISRAEVARGVTEELDQEALRVVNSMPNWIPAESDGKVIATKVRLPIRFTLN